MFSYEKCWAKVVSECGESLPSSDGGNARTAPESLPETHVAGLGVQVLCGRHEAELAPLDRALADLMNCAREVERLRVLRAGIARKDWPQVHLTVDGVRIERCVLKMLMSCSVFPANTPAAWTPPEWLPLVIFGRRALEANCGLGVVARVGDIVTTAEEMRFELGEPQSSGELHSAMLEIRGGWRLICSWDRPLASLGTLRFSGSSYAADSDVLYHPRRIKFTHGARDLGVSLDFDWSGTWTASKHRSVAALRTKKNPA